MNIYLEKFKNEIEEFLLLAKRLSIIKSLGFDYELFVRNVCVVDIDDDINIRAIAQFSHLNSIEMIEHKFLHIKINPKEFYDWINIRVSELAQ